LAWLHIESESPPAAAAKLVATLIEGSDDLRAQLPRDEWIVDQAFDVLATKTNTGVDALLSQLKSPTVAVRKDAIHKLSTLSPCPPAAMTGILQGLNDSDPDVRAWSAFLLGYFGDNVIQMRHVVGNGTFPSDLEKQLEVSARSAVPGLVKRLSAEKDETVRGAVWRALKGLALWSTPDVNKLADKSHDAQETIELINTIKRAKPRELCARLDDLDKKSTWMVGCVLLRIARENPDSIVPLLVARLRKYPAAVEEAAQLLGQIGPPASAASNALRKLIDHPYEGARKSVRQALVRIAPDQEGAKAKSTISVIREQLGAGASKRLIELVADLTDDTKTTKQFTALWEISKFGKEAEAALPFLHDAMRKSWLRFDAAGAIGRIQPETIRPMLPELLQDFRKSKLQGDFADRVIPFLAYLGPDLQADAIKFFIGCLPSPGRQPRRAAEMIPHALSYLGTSSPSELLPMIIRLLSVRWETEAGTLGPVPPILRFLKKRGAAYSEALPVVVPKLKNVELRPLALETISRIGTWTTALPHLTKFAQSEDADCRQVVAARRVNQSKLAIRKWHGRGLSISRQYRDIGPRK
jgi:hypothetical protein